MSPAAPFQCSPRHLPQPGHNASGRNASGTEPVCSVLEQFVHQSVSTPDASALVGTAETLTYQQLDQRSNQLAHYLQQRVSTASQTDSSVTNSSVTDSLVSNDLVAVQLRRSPAAIIAFLAVLKAGLAYVPIDPNYPESRRNYILKDSKSTLLLTEGCFADALSEYSNPRIYK